MTQRFFALLLSICLFSIPLTTYADSTPGDVIITLGESLTQQQEDALLDEMGNPEEPLIVYITNKEEHQYLGSYISKAQIGTKALSSAKIIIGEEDSGLEVSTHNINWVTDEMYVNAMSTAGVKDADVYVTAPFAVSGTAALTGILKAYEISTNTKIPEGKKQVANEEMVKTAKLSEDIGDDKAVDLMNEIKKEIATNKPKTTDDIRALIRRVAERLNIQLSEEDINGLVSLFDKMSNLNIDWKQVGKNLDNAKGKFDEIMKQEETKNFLSSFGNFFKKLISIINGWFS